jgi:drug/metabolite transporter (DMT)-like permease
MMAPMTPPPAPKSATGPAGVSPAAGPAANPMLAIALMVGAGFIFSGMDALAKGLTQTYPVQQVIWARYSIHLVIVLAYLLAIERRPLGGLLHSRRPMLQLGRSLAVVLSSAFFTLAIKFIPLADATAINFVTPLLVTALSVPLLREKVGIRRWTAVGIGFLSVLIIIRPGPGMAHWAVVLPLGSAVAFALYQIMTRQLAAIDSWPTTLFYSAIVGVGLTSLVVPFGWVAPDWQGWLGFAGLGVLGGASHLLLIRAFTLATASTLAPFTYVQLIWAILWGVLLFANVPDLWTVLGALVIAGSGLYVLFRENHLRRAGRL